MNTTRRDWKSTHRRYRRESRGIAPEIRPVVVMSDARRHVGRLGDWTSIGHAAAWLHLASIARRHGNASEARYCISKATAQRRGAVSRLP